MTEPTAQDLDEAAPEASLVTTQFRPDLPNHNPATVVFERAARFGSIGHYDLVQQLGRSMFVGHHRVTKQAFAIRLLEPIPGRPELVERQLVAARALARIDHPNVVRTIEVGLHEGRVYVVMEQLRGKTLASALEMHGVPSSAQVIRIGTHVARGLEALHLQGLIHRNLDAESVIIVPSERGRSTIKLVDFEIEPGVEVVRIARHSMSPELCRGGAIDHRTDLYSLGVLLHHASTLKYPFEGTPIEIMAMYRFRSVARPNPALAGVPAELAATIRRCLAEEPADRYRTAGEVLEALRLGSEGQGRHGRPEAPSRARARAPSGPISAPDRSRVAAPMPLDLDSVPTEQRASASTPAPALAKTWPAAYAASAPHAAPVRYASSASHAGSAPHAVSAPHPAPVSYVPSAPHAAVPEPIDPAHDSSGILVAPSGPAYGGNARSGPAYAATALSLDPAAARAAARAHTSVSRRGVPWKPIAVLVAAVAAGCALSMWTLRGGDHASAAPSAVASAAPPAAAPPAAAPPAAAPPAAAPPVLPVPSCAPSAPALVPDVVLSVDAQATEPTGGEARPSEVRELRDDPPRKSRRKSKPRKAKPADDPPAEQRLRADDAPTSGETIVVPDEEPRKRTRRHGIDRIHL